MKHEMVLNWYGCALDLPFWYVLLRDLSRLPAPFAKKLPPLGRLLFNHFVNIEQIDFCEALFNTIQNGVIVNYFIRNSKTTLSCANLLRPVSQTLSFYDFP